MFGSVGPTEIIVVAVVVVLLFGVGKISGLGKELGSSIKEFRKAVKDPDDEVTQAQPQMAAQVQPPVQQAPVQQAPVQQTQVAPPPVATQAPAPQPTQQASDGQAPKNIF